MRTRVDVYRRWFACALFALASTAADAASPELTIVAAGRTQKLATEVLLAHPAAVTVSVPSAPISKP
jgi:hypothetical protein